MGNRKRPLKTASHRSEESDAKIPVKKELPGSNDVNALTECKAIKKYPEKEKVGGKAHTTVRICKAEWGKGKFWLDPGA